MGFRLAYFTKRAIEAMVRGPYVTGVGIVTVFVAIFATGLFAGTLGGAERLLDSWAGQVRISVYLLPGKNLESVRDAVLAAAPGREVRVITAAEALRGLAQDLGDDAHVLQGVGPEALPDSVEVAAPGISLEDARVLAATLQSIPGVERVDFGNVWLERLERAISGTKLVALVLFVALALATAVLVGNTLRIAVFARREEIEIMKLVGATDSFVVTPFLLEGIFQGILGSLLAVASLLGLHALIIPRIRAVVQIADGLSLSDTLPPSLLLSLIAGGAFVGFLGSALSVVRVLRRA